MAGKSDGPHGEHRHIPGVRRTIAGFVFHAGHLPFPRRASYAAHHDARYLRSIAARHAPSQRDAR